MTGRWSEVRRAAVARAITLLAGFVARLPEGFAIRVAELAGSVAYRVSADRRARARRNLARVARWLRDHDLGTPLARQAADDPRALERLVRAAFRHHARYYLEVVRTPRIGRRYVTERLLVETPDTVAEAFGDPRAAIVIGLHFGAIELPALWFATQTGREAVAPMEELRDRRLQAWFVRTRGSARIRIVGLREARRVLTAALAAGSAVGLVADRDLTGGGIDTALFGATAPLPAGPALLAIETGAPVYVAGVRRAGRGRYRGRLEPIPVPASGSRRQRVEAILASEAAVFERVIADAPEQWWAVFSPIWPDLEPAEEAGRVSGRAGQAARAPAEETR
jgi:lauroyl/myristoyl acyltransferase